MGSLPSNYHQRAAEDVGQWRERLGWGDGRGDRDGVDDEGGKFFRHFSWQTLMEFDLFMRTAFQWAPRVGPSALPR